MAFCDFDITPVKKPHAPGGADRATVKLLAFSYDEPAVVKRR